MTSFVAGLPAQGHSFLSRFLAAIFPGERYAAGLDGVESLEALHGEIAADLKSLFETGFNVQASISSIAQVFIHVPSLLVIW